MGGVRPQPAAQIPAAFVCEDDVRAAMKAGRKVVIDEKTIVTPSARDLGEAQKVFVEAGWPR
jgi:ethanolamine utilization cobalamin adenosyltransferase